MKFTRILFAAALVISAACTKEQELPEEKGMTTIEAVNPIVVPFKTTTSDGVNVKWENNDEIALFVSGGQVQESAIFQTKITTPSATASFDMVSGKQPVRQGDKFMAVYPASQLYKWNSAGNMACSMDLPYEQTVSGPGWDKKASIMASSSSTNKFVFRHCVAYLMFSISEGSSIKSFSVSTGTENELIASRVSVAVSDDNDVTVRETTPAGLQSTTATLVMADGGTFPAGTYYVAILPKTYTNGFVWKFTDASGKVIERKVGGQVVMNASWVANLGNEKAAVIGGIDPLKPFDIFNVPKRISLVGDSITTYEGTLVTNFADAKNGGAYYPIYDENGVPVKVTSVTEQYWYKLINNKMKNAVLEVNNSLRGSMVTRRTQDNYLNVDFTARTILYGLGSPDVVFIHGGTNDCTTHDSKYEYRPGMYRADMLLSDDFLTNSFDKGFVDNEAYELEKYKGMTSDLPTDGEFKAVFDVAEAADTWEELCALEDRSFIHSYVKLLNIIHFKHPHAKVVMIIGDALTKRCMQAIQKIAEHYDSLYGYKCVNFFDDKDNISKASGAHPDGDGFTFMADKIYKEVGSYIDPQN